MEIKTNLKTRDIAPYLEYKPNCITDLGVRTISTLASDGNINRDSDCCESFWANYVILILKPMSQLFSPENAHVLKKIITILGYPYAEIYEVENTVQCGIDKLAEDGIEAYYIGWNFDIGCFCWYHEHYIPYSSNQYLTGDIVPYNSEVYQVLYEEKFDVMGLIDKGDAIDVKDVPEFIAKLNKEDYLNKEY